MGCSVVQFPFRSDVIEPVKYVRIERCQFETATLHRNISMSEINFTVIFCIQINNILIRINPKVRLSILSVTAITAASFHAESCFSHGHPGVNLNDENEIELCFRANHTC